MTTIDNINTQTSNSILISKQSYCINTATSGGNIIDFLMESLIPVSQNSSFWFFKTGQDKTVKVAVPQANYQYFLKGYFSAEPVQSKANANYFTVSIKGDKISLQASEE